MLNPESAARLLQNELERKHAGLNGDTLNNTDVLMLVLILDLWNRDVKRTENRKHPVKNISSLFKSTEGILSSVVAIVSSFIALASLTYEYRLYFHIPSQAAPFVSLFFLMASVYALMFIATILQEE